MCSLHVIKWNSKGKKGEKNNQFSLELRFQNKFYEICTFCCWLVCVRFFFIFKFFLSHSPVLRAVFVCHYSSRPIKIYNNFVHCIRKDKKKRISWANVVGSLFGWFTSFTSPEIPFSLIFQFLIFPVFELINLFVCYFVVYVSSSAYERSKTTDFQIFDLKLLEAHEKVCYVIWINISSKTKCTTFPHENEWGIRDGSHALISSFFIIFYVYHIYIYILSGCGDSFFLTFPFSTTICQFRSFFKLPLHSFLSIPFHL